MARAARRRAVTVRVEMLNRLAQPDSTAARNAADVLGEFRYPVVDPGAVARRSRTRCSTRARRARPWRGRWAASRGRRSVAPLTTALRAPTARMVRVAALQALQSIAGLRDGRAVAPLLSDRTCRCAPRRRPRWACSATRAGPTALVTALQNDHSPRCASAPPGRWARSGASSAVAGPGAAERRRQRRQPVRPLAGRERADHACPASAQACANEEARGFKVRALLVFLRRNPIGRRSALAVTSEAPTCVPSAQRSRPGWRLRVAGWLPGA